MSRNSNTISLTPFILLLAVVVFVKLVWVGLAFIYLPEKGISDEKGRTRGVLHYRYHFASDTALPKVQKSVPKKPLAKSFSIQNVKLVGIYSAPNESIVTLLKKEKSYILSKGENIDGFVLKGASAREAYFEKNNKEYTLKLFEEKIKGKSSITSTDVKDSNQSTGDKKEAINSQDGITVIPRGVLKTYVSDMDKAMKDIGLRPIRRDNQMIGYKVRFIRKGSPFSQLGLERGDIIKAINGEEIADFNGAMSILKSTDTIEGLTITVIRKNEEKELEYEIK